MGFFKKIGNSVKKFAKKNIRFKNVVKLASNVVPGVGGAIIGAGLEAHEMKKAAKLEQNEAIRNAMLERASQMAQNAGSKAGDYAETLGGTAVRAFGKKLADKATDAYGDIAGYAGANVAESTMSEFFKRHWLKIVGIGIGIPLLFVMFKKLAK